MSRRSKKNLTKLKLRNSTRVFLVILSLAIFAIASANFYNSIFKNDTKKIEEDIYTYKNEFKSDYTVNIKENPFISEDTLDSGQTYISDLISSLDMQMHYTYSGSKPSNLTYHYKIEAIVGASYTDDGKEYNVWNKTYPIKTVEDVISEDGISIDENIHIDYPKYHQEVKSFKQSLGMSIDAFLYIKLTVNTTTVINHQEINNQYVSNFSISLGDKVAVVDTKNEDVKVDSVKQNNTIAHNDINASKLLISLIIMVISLYVIYFVRCKTKKFNTIPNEFRLELNRILKSCQDRIVIVKNQLGTEDEDVIDVNDFGELIKLSEELYKPILCWISDDLNNEEAWFSIISNKIRYRFILKK
ncbi:MAG: hypothetical protein J6A04_01585 [Clostridia bacterium]|nr:hypothetical protein [Clostridia bacterium]